MTQTPHVPLERTTPEEAGFAPDLDQRLSQARAAGLLPNVHAVVAARGGRIFWENYWVGTDADLARPLGLVTFGPETLHDLRSVTKSIVGLLYGIALEAGHVPPPGASLLAQFPDHPDLAADPARQAITVGHALSMTLGMEWDEISLPYSDPRNSEIAMDRASDRCRYVLERPVIEPPGQHWVYCGGATALLAHLIARGVGQPIERYARAVLFDPLGIGPTEWRRGAHDTVSAASGLRMTPRDLLRIGCALLGHGQQVVPRAWIDAALSRVVALPDGRYFGYHWYLGATPMDDGSGGVQWERTTSAMGNGGQRLFLLPGLELAVVVTAGNYNHPVSWRPPTTILRDVLLPARRS